MNMWEGVVEERISDPNNLGRCRVRVIGVHTSDKQLLPTDHLPYATIMVPVSHGSGNSPSRIKEGDTVCGYWRDGDAMQNPCIIGIIPGINQSDINYQNGFTDARSSSDLQNAPRAPTSLSYTNTGSTVNSPSSASKNINSGKPDISPRSTGGNTVYSNARKSGVLSNVKSANLTQWSEPVGNGSPKYPYIDASVTESGHEEEWDDTPGNERILRAHRVGSFEEFHPDGSLVTKIVGSNYEIYLQGNNCYISGTLNITVNGSANVLVSQNAYVEIDGNLNASIKGNATATVTGTTTVNAKSDLIVTGSADIDIQAAGIMNLTANVMNLTANPINLNG